jgi:hypothetical protein
MPQGRILKTIAKTVSNDYGVPLVEADELENLASEFGQRCPEELYPDKPEELEIDWPTSQIHVTGSGRIITGSGSGLMHDPNATYRAAINSFFGKTKQTQKSLDRITKPQKRKPKRNSARQGPPQSRGNQFNQNRNK